MKKTYIAPITETIVPFQSLLEQDLSGVTGGNAAGDDETEWTGPDLNPEPVGGGSTTIVPDAKQGRWDLWEVDW